MKLPRGIHIDPRHVEDDGTIIVAFTASRVRVWITLWRIAIPFLLGRLGEDAHAAAVEYLAADLRKRADA